MHHDVAIKNRVDLLAMQNMEPNSEKVSRKGYLISYGIIFNDALGYLPCETLLALIT